MNIQAAKDQVKDTVEAYLAKDEAGMYVIDPVHQRPVFLVGAPGIGKTAIMSQVARELGIGMVSYSMTHHTRQSALGLPSIEEKEFDGHAYKASEYTMSEIVAAIYDYMNNTGLRQGILFLDEINCVSETLYPSMLQFLQFKTFGKHKVPDDWVIVCAGNPPEYNRSVHEFDIVTLDRLREIDVEPDYGVWKNYAKEQGLHPAVTTFLEAKNDCFYKVESKPGGGKSFVTARGWEDLADIIATYEQLGKPVNRDLFAQFLKDEDIADQFAVYYTLFEKYRSDYQVGKILSGYATDAIRKRAKEAEFDERVALL
ncbi:MAG: AAA family ATPase, partial [Coriobacteriales bacterium]